MMGNYSKYMCIAHETCARFGVVASFFHEKDSMNKNQKWVPLRVVVILFRKKMGHTAFSDTASSSVTLLTWRKEQEEILYFCILYLTVHAKTVLNQIETKFIQFV